MLIPVCFSSNSINISTQPFFPQGGREVGLPLHGEVLEGSSNIYAIGM